MRLVTLVKPALEFDLKSNDSKQIYIVEGEGEYKYWRCESSIGVEFRPDVIYLRVARDEEARKGETHAAVIPSWEKQI